MLHNPIVKGALIGLWTALSVDVGLFLHSNSWKVEGFTFKIAAKKWVSGLITGALGAAGLGAL